MRITLIACFLLAALETQAQYVSVVDGATPTGIAPGAPAGTNALSSFDRHNPFSGSLSPALTLYHVGGRGEAGFDLIWNFQQTWAAAKRFGGGDFFIPIDPYPSNNLVGYESAAGPLGAGAVFSRTGSNFTSCPNGGSAVGATLGKIVFEAPDGTQVELTDQNTHGAVYNIPNACNQTPNSVDAGRGTLFQSTDGSAINFISDSNVVDNTAPGFGEADAKVSGALHFSSGVTYRIDNSRVSWITDRNGNKTTFAYDSGAFVPVTWYLFVDVPSQITDSIGRVITLNYNDSSCNGCTSVTYPGFGGAPRSIKIYQTHLSSGLLRDSGTSVETIDQLFPGTHQPDSYNFDPVLASSIVLPDGSQYGFKYNIYGELARVNLPTGGAVEYDFGDGSNSNGDGFVGNPTDNNPVMIYRRLQERREYSSGGSAMTSRTHFSVSTVNGNTVETQITYDPSANQLAQTIHTMAGSPTDALALSGTGCNAWNEGLEIQTDYGSPNPIRTVTNSYAAQTGCMNNPQLTTQTTKLDDSGQVSKVTLAYDQFNNVTDKAEYDWGTPGAGALLRDTKTVYLYQSSGAYGAPTVNLVRAPFYSTVYDSNNNQVAGSVWQYDTSDVQPATGITGHDDTNYGTGFKLRANPTLVSAVLNPGNTFINSAMTYDVAGNILTVTDPNNHLTTLLYGDSYQDGVGRGSFAHPTNVINALNQITTAQYDYWTGATTSSQDANGIATNYQYGDLLDRVTLVTAGVSATNGLNAKTVYSYPNPNTAIVQQDQSPDAVLKTQTLYDGLGRPVESDNFTTQTGYIATTTTYDALGRTLTTSNPFANGDPVNVTSYSYDSLSRPSQTQTPDGAIAAMSYLGNTSTVTDQALNKKRYTYNGLGWLSNVLEDPGGANQATTDYRYDALGNLTLVSQGYCNPCQQRYFTYDSLSRLLSANNPESGTVTYSYNLNGTLQSRTDARNVVTAYSYDALNRLTQKTYNDGTPGVTFVYDSTTYPNSIGRLSQISNANSSTIYTGYDALGRVTGTQQISQGQTYSFSYGYNLAGSLISETYPSGRTINMAYDMLNRVNQVSGNKGGVPTVYLDQLTYTAFGGPLAYKYGNQLWRNTTYNNRLQAVSSVDQKNNDAGQQLLNMGWNWGTTNNNGNLLGIAQANGVPNATGTLTFNQSFSYDSVNRLSTATDDGGWSRSYGYDKVGNRWLSATSGVPVNGATPMSNVYTANNQIAGNSYDANGNQTSFSGNTLSFDAENRLVTITEPGSMGGGTETIQYDGNDQRVAKISGSNTTVYVYDLTGQLAAEYSTNPSTAPCTTCYLSTDQLGTPRLITDGSDNLIARHDYLPFGEEIGANTAGRNSQWGPANDNVNQKFTGQERDSETGLDYFQARYMASTLGRFISPDPENAGADLTDPQTWNGYGYVRNSPLIFTDPNGQFLASAAGAAAGGPVGAIVGGIVDLFGLFFGLFGHGHGGATAPPPIPAVPPVSSYPGVEIGEVTSSNNGPLAEDIINTAGGSQSDTVFYAEAIAYLNRDAVMARIIRQLQRSRKVYTVSFINNGDDSYLSGKVYWDPTSSLRTTSGGCQSAALGLGHELSHAYEQDQYPYWFAREQGVSAGSYGNQVEKWAITGPETHAARKLGESTRSDHGGQTRHETDATSRNCRQP